VKLICTGADLSRAAAWAAKIAPSNPATPVMAGVLLDAGDVLTLSATDYETFGTATCNAIIQDQGRTVVSARLLAAVAKAITPPAAEATLVSDGSRLEVRCGKSRWALPEMATDLWPTFPGAGEPIGKVGGAQLERALDRVLPAAGKPDIEPPIFAGVRLTFTEGLRLEASDRYRIATADLPWQPAIGEAEPIVVPATVLKHAAAAGDVEISTEGGTVGLKSGGFTVLGRLLAGQFPKEFDGYVTRIKGSTKTTATIDTQALLSTINGVTVVLSTEAHILLAFTEDGVNVSPISDKTSNDDGDADSEVDLQSFDGPEITVKTKHAVIADALRCLDSPSAGFQFTGNKNAPFVIEPVDDSGKVLDDYSHVLVPLVQKAKP
jgi:DNA polymerase-3 subunit beta